MGFALCAWLCLGIELLNRWTDQREDRVNNPARTELCDRIGYRDIGILAAMVFVVLAPIGVVWFALWGNVDVLVLQAICWLVALNYSAGLRFKARRFVVLVILGGTFVLPFIVGWVMYAPLSQLPPVLLFAPVFVASLAGIKDITDVSGDVARGYKSLFVELLGAGRGRLLGLLASPYLVLVTMVWARWVPERFLVLLAFAPGSLLFSVLVSRAGTAEEKAAVRETMYHFWFAFLVTTLFLIHPVARLAAVLLFASGFWVVATRWLHWRRGLDAAHARMLAAILGPRTPRTPTLAS